MMNGVDFIMKIIYGTGNKGKIEEVINFFKANKIDIEVLSLKDISFDEEIIENGKTFEENSLIKAKAIKEFCKQKNINEIIVTDDAGLCVDALDGRPGVYSARYAGDHAPQEKTINKLLNELKDVPENRRTATFVCVLTCILQDGESFSVRGETKGRIATKPGLMGKLTYGPIFVPEKFGKVMNELSQEELGETHREKALKELVIRIKKGE